MFADHVVHWRHHADLCIAEIECSQAPDLVALAEYNPTRYPFLLESSAGAMAQSRYDLLLAFPGRVIQADPADKNSPDWFARLDQAAAGEACAAIPGVVYPGGWFVYLGYEMAGRIEPSVAQPPAQAPGLPDALAVRCPAALVFDKHERKLQAIAEDNDRERVEAMLADLAGCDAGTRHEPLAADWREQPPRDYTRMVEAARALIHAGDVFQVNLSRAWHGRLAAPHAPARIYAALRSANPAPFSGLVQWGDEALCCSSPERLLTIDQGIAQTRPIAGTRARTPGTDADMTGDLLGHPKERAEHVMLIDLERNDLGRVSRPGSIHVDELMRAESYTHVHHIVSNIRARLDAGTGPGRALKAVFPGGTITGCPKVRCMQIIAELEAEPRGAYTGSFGYLTRAGRLDTNIIIRSLTQRGRTLTLRTGAGIVADSDPQQELEETRVKARGVLRSFIDHKDCAHG